MVYNDRPPHRKDVFPPDTEWTARDELFLDTAHEVESSKNYNKLLALYDQEGTYGNGPLVALDVAVEQQFPLSVIKSIVKRGVYAGGYQDRTTSTVRDPEVLNFLYKSGANIHSNNENALWWASHNGFVGIVKYLLNHGSNVHALDDEALMTAVYNQDPEIVDLLLRAGANPDARNGLAFQLAGDHLGTVAGKAIIAMLRDAAETP